MQNFYTPGLAASLATVTASITLDIAQEFNRELDQLTTFEGFYLDLLSTFHYKYRWGESYVRMNYLADINIYKPKVYSGTAN